MNYLIIFFIFLSSIFAKDINVATYNVENLFDGVNEGSEYKDYRVSRYGWNKNMANIKFDHTIKAIRLIKADIIALQEIENQNLLTRMAKKLGYRYFAFTKPIGSPVGVGVLSKYPIIDKESIKPGIDKMRDFLHVVVDIKGKHLGLWVVHFPTQKYPLSKRLKVAKTLKRAVEKSNDKEFLLLGDFNTKISSNSILQRTFGALNDKKGYYDPWFSLSFSNRYSQVFYGRKSALDRIILNEGMFDKKGLEYKKNSFKVIKSDFLSDEKGYPNRWKMRGKHSKKRHQGEGYSDHFPVMLTITTNPQKNIEPKNMSIDNLYEQKNGNCDIKIQKATVIYKKRDGLILSQKSRGIYVYRAGFNLKIGHQYDLIVKSIKEYKGLKEITSLEILKDYGKINNLKDYYLSPIKLKNAKISDVIKNISGIYKKGYLLTENGKISLFFRDKQRVKDGDFLDITMIRVGIFKDKLQLIWEKDR